MPRHSLAEKLSRVILQPYRGQSNKAAQAGIQQNSKHVSRLASAGKEKEEWKTVQILLTFGDKQKANHEASLVHQMCVDE